MASARERNRTGAQVEVGFQASGDRLEEFPQNVRTANYAKCYRGVFSRQLRQMCHLFRMRNNSAHKFVRLWKEPMNSNFKTSNFGPMKKTVLPLLGLICGGHRPP